MNVFVWNSFEHRFPNTATASQWKMLDCQTAKARKTFSDGFAASHNGNYNEYEHKPMSGSRHNWFFFLCSGGRNALSHNFRALLLFLGSDFCLGSDCQIQFALWREKASRCISKAKGYQAFPHFFANYEANASSANDSCSNGRTCRKCGCGEVRSSNAGSIFNMVLSTTIQTLLQETSGPMVIDFFATWCGPCVLLAPQLEEVAEHYKGKVRFLKVDCDENDSLASALKVSS